MSKNFRKVIIVILIFLGLLFITGYIYRTFFRPVYAGTNNPAGLLIPGILIGALIAYLVFLLINRNKNEDSVRSESHTVAESIKKVFKIVVAEGQLNDVYNYENTKKLLKFIPLTKKALIIVKARVMIGYDIEKCRWLFDQQTKTISLLEFPQPEILSIETDFNYYHFEEEFFNLISRKDLQLMQELGKEQIRNAALQSSLMKIAADQMKLLLQEVVSVHNWRIENMEDIVYKKTPPVIEPEES